MRTSPPGWDITELLGEIAETGRDSVRGGYSRHLFEAAERSLRGWFATRAQSLGLDVEVDKNANIWAHWGAPGPGTIGVGSHLDSVPGGGALDGPLGVASALSAIAALRADGARPSRPVAVVAFAEEEGSRFGVACLGSKLMTGEIAPDTVRNLADPDGVTFRDAAARFGLDPDGIGPDEDRLASLAAFVELHVEQGRGLADIGAPVAVASGILAHGRWRLRFGGEGNHAGATTMAGRRDPVVAAAAAILAAREIAARRDDPARGHHARATVGRLVPVPGGTNVIASRVDAWLDVRGDTDEATRALIAEISAAVRARAAEYGCAAEITEESYSGPVAFDPGLRGQFTTALGGPPVLATGAGHDAGVLASVLPTAMLFVRNPTGVSHSPYESASDADCRAGVQALGRVLENMF
ncbi:MAG TPA: allantoate amidohydrolase [Trebonia sp.]|nr:allantoate amidohydrolase [Trebonia sp.]